MGKSSKNQDNFSQRVNELIELSRKNFVVQKHNDMKLLSVPIHSLQDLGCTVASMLNVCATASEFVNEDHHTASEYDISKVLTFAMKLLPLDELGVLDEIIK